jgi:hypothetical protein
MSPRVARHSIDRGGVDRIMPHAAFVSFVPFVVNLSLAGR